jgi:hypothetical protein
MIEREHRVNRNVRIEFSTRGWGTVTVSGVVRALAGAGWGLTQPDGASSYATEDRAGSLVWTTVRQETPEAVAAALDAPPRDGQRAGVTLFHDKAGTGGQRLFAPEQDAIDFLPTINRRALPASERLTDLAWYLQMMLPALHTCGLMGYTVRDHFD